MVLSLYILMLQDNSLSYSEKESPIVFGRALLLQFLFLEILYNDLINRWIYNSSCLYYCKDTLFEAIHNFSLSCYYAVSVVCITAKIHFLKQFTTKDVIVSSEPPLFVLLQRYTF